MKVLPIEIYLFLQLKTLIASKCAIHRLYDIGFLDKMVTLKLDSNHLESDMLGSLPASLKSVSIACNHFVTIPIAIYELPGLVQLNLSGNRLENLLGIGQLVCLVELNLDDNNITELPEEICNLTKLRAISLKRNKIAKTALNSTNQSIPEKFFTDTSIDNINLQGNIELKQSEVLKFIGIEVFLQRRKLIKDKTLFGGALTDSSLFGLE
jgi:leucine-rich repeat protein SHOC2